jgi:hypothetical protein
MQQASCLAARGTVCAASSIMIVEFAHVPRAERAVVQAALVVIVGVLLSGPVALVAVAMVHPQPAWEGAERFAAELHPIQLLPYVGGFVLIGGCVALVASLHALVPEQRRARANLALALAAAFAALILLNYIIQTTFVPSLVRPYRAEHAALVEALAMANPRSLAWALEMWGYGVFGVATWAIACAFGSSRIERVTAATFVANGVISIVGGFATMLAPDWPHTTAGFTSFAAWNALVVVMGILTIVAMRRRRSA